MVQSASPVGALIDRLLEDFDMTDCNPKSTPLAPGSVLVLASDDELLSKEETTLYRRGAATITWASVCCRPDLSHAASQLGKVQSKPTKRHMRHLRHVIAYCKGTRGYGLRYRQTQHGERMHGFADASWADCPDTRRSTAGYVAYMFGAPISYHARVMKTVALSTAESELMALTEAGGACVTCGTFLLGGSNRNWNRPKKGGGATAALAMASDINQSVTTRTKHTAARHFWTRDQTKWSKDDEGNDLPPPFELYHVATDMQRADIMAKAPPKPAFGRHRDEMVELVDATTTVSSRVNYLSWRGRSTI